MALKHSTPRWSRRTFLKGAGFGVLATSGLTGLQPLRMQSWAAGERTRFIPTTTLLEHTLLTQGFTGVQKAAFTCRLRPQNRDSTWVDLVNTLK